MLRSRAVAQVKPLSSCRTVLILGIGNGLFTICLLTPPKSLTTCSVLPFLVWWKLTKPMRTRLPFEYPQVTQSLDFLFSCFSSAFWVFGKVSHSKELLLPSIRAKLDNPSCLVSHQIAPQILAGDPVMMLCLGHWGSCYNRFWQLSWDPFFVFSV